MTLSTYLLIMKHRQSPKEPLKMTQDWQSPLIRTNAVQMPGETEICADPELWLPVPEFESRYDVSDHGRIRSWRTGSGRLLNKPQIRSLSHSKKGYLFVTLQDASKKQMKGFRVSRIVLLAFRGCPPSPLHEASHLDGNKANNSLGNLAWETSEENNARKEVHGTAIRGEMHGNAKLNEARIREIRTRWANGEKVHVLAYEFNVTHSAISSVVNRRTWTSVE